MIKVNGRIIEIDKFPNGESNVRIPDHWLSDEPNMETTMTYELKYESDSDLFQLYFIKKHFDSLAKVSFTILKCYYFPYSRMDRVKTFKDVFTLKYVTDFINSLGFDSVLILDAHSDVAPALLNNVDNTSVIDSLLSATQREGNYNPSSDYIYFPDSGAEKRYSYLVGVSQVKTLTAIKHRNFSTGKIESLKVIGDSDLAGRNVVMVDDLCSFGGTFMLGAKELKARGAGNIFLCVAHCEDSIFKGEILTTPYISKVYTTDSILTKESEKIKIVEIY